uniref:4-hydroxyphenylpyruvate dioxygenase n=1 Tax=Spongospora subterranea TaxID=70186 RepID=A0A0H5RAY7_9EUKA|eukprot:CRZ11345.1 hypothetical protein [Spongospora subterranea]
MTTYVDKGSKPAIGQYYGFDHINLWVSNAKQAASFYVTRFGFTPVAYSGLETGDRSVATHVVRQNKIILAFSSWLLPESSPMTEHVAKHGDGVRCVAFSVNDAKGMYAEAIRRGAVSVEEPKLLQDANGSVITATVRTYGDTVHTLVERKSYSGPFLPGYVAVDVVDPLGTLLPSPGLNFIDHCVANLPDGQMLEICNWYEKVLQFHRFWSVDDTQIHTEYSSLRSTVMADYDETVKMPINEPAKGKRKSQIQEYVDYYGGGGVQHIAFNTEDIITAIQNLKARGLQFLSVPTTYYDDLRLRLSKSPTKVKESLDIIQKENILVDFDDRGYLLQIFTKPIEDRPTLFFEIIQRRSHSGFGAGNFKALFESIEREQAIRGNLMAM